MNYRENKNAQRTAARIDGSKELVRLLQGLAYSRRLGEVWRDFVNVAAVAISNKVDGANFDVREAQYMDVIKRYSKEEAQQLAHAVGAMWLGMQQGEIGDFLGQTYMSLDLGSSARGQYFTPYSLCQAIAAMTLQDASKIIEAEGFITIGEPAAGSGAMVLAAADHLEKCGHDVTQCLYVSATDVDLQAVQMCYLQLSIHGIPAQVICANSLSSEKIKQEQVWTTPMYCMNNWGEKLRKRRERIASEQAQPAIFQLDSLPAVGQTQLKRQKSSAVSDQLSFFWG